MWLVGTGFAIAESSTRHGGDEVRSRLRCSSGALGRTASHARLQVKPSKNRAEEEAGNDAAARGARSNAPRRAHRRQSPPTPTGLLTGVLVKVGYAKYVRPRSGENFGVVAALVKPPAAVAASTGREREGKRAPRSGIFFRSSCIFESEKHQNPL